MSREGITSLIYGVTIEVAVRDLLGANTDVIVNPANSGLSHGGGLAAEILAAAGPELEAECETYIREHGPLKVGYACATTAGHMTHKGVIHLVGPRLGDGDEENKIARGVIRALKICDERGWRSIAFPAISAGLFSVPVESSARGLRAGIRYYLKNTDDSGLERIRICCTQEHYEAFAKVF